MGASFAGECAPLYARLCDKLAFFCYTLPVNIAFGHSNMDLDCLGSLILVKKIFPDHVLVRSRIIHPAAYSVYNLYKEYFDFINPKDLENEKIDHIIIVDTSSADRVREYFKCIYNSDPGIPFMIIIPVKTVILQVQNFWENIGAPIQVIYVNLPWKKE